MQLEFLDEIDSSTLKYVLDQTKGLADGSNVELIIGSYGGEILVAFGIIDLLKRFHTHAFIMGFACSAAAILAVSCEECTMYEHSSLMLHSAWCDDTDSDDPGIQRCNALQLEIINKRCPQYTAEMLKTDTWISAEQCLQLHLTDNIYIDDPVDYQAVAQKYAAKLNKISNRRKPMADINEIIEEVKEEVIEEKPAVEETVEVEAPAENEEPAEEEVKHDLIEVIEKLSERVEELEARLKALEEPSKDEEPKEMEAEEDEEPEDKDQERINNLYNSICKPCAVAPVACASAKPVVKKIRKGFEAFAKI